MLNSSPESMDSLKPRILAPQSCATRRLHHLQLENVKQLVVCGLLSMRLAHQISMNSSSRQSSKATLLWTSRTYTTTLRCVSMQWLDSDKTFLLITSPSKDTLSLKNTLSQISLTLHILGIHRPTFPLETKC